MALNVEALAFSNIKYYLYSRKDLGQDRLNNTRDVWLDFTSILPASLKDPLRDRGYFTDQDFATADQRNIWYTEPSPTGGLSEQQLEKDPRWKSVKNAKILCDLSKESKNVPSWQNTYELDFFKIFRDRVQGSSRERRRTRTNFYYDAFKSNENRTWSEVDRLRQNFQYARDLPTPTPSHAFHFPLFPGLFGGGEWLRVNKHSFSSLCTDSMVQNFRIETLRHLSEHGLVSRAAGFNNSDPTSAQMGCFPWLVAEIANPAGEYDRDLCFRRAVNAASATLLMYENAAKFAEHKTNQQNIPPVPVVTAIGPEIRLWIAYAEFDHKGRSNHMETVWKGNITNIIDSICFRTLLENVHTWATRVLRPQLSTYIEQWLYHFPYVPESSRETRSRPTFSSEDVNYGSDPDTKNQIEPSIKRVFDLISNIVQLHPQSPHRAPLAQLLHDIFADERLVIKKKVESNQKPPHPIPKEEFRVPSAVVDEPKIDSSLNSFSFNVDKWLKDLDDGQAKATSSDAVPKNQRTIFTADFRTHNDERPSTQPSKRQSRTSRSWHGRTTKGRLVKVRLPPIDLDVTEGAAVTGQSEKPIWDIEAIPILPSDRAKRIPKNSSRTILVPKRLQGKKTESADPKTPEKNEDGPSSSKVTSPTLDEECPFPYTDLRIPVFLPNGLRNLKLEPLQGPHKLIPFLVDQDALALTSSKPVTTSRPPTETPKDEVNEIDKKPAFMFGKDRTTLLGPSEPKSNAKTIMTHNEPLNLMSDMEALALIRSVSVESAANSQLALEVSKDEAKASRDEGNMITDTLNAVVPVSPEDELEKASISSKGAVLVSSEDEVGIASVESKAIAPGTSGMPDHDSLIVERSNSPNVTPTSSPKSKQGIIASSEQNDLAQKDIANSSTKTKSHIQSLLTKGSFEWDFGQLSLKPLPSEARATPLESLEKLKIFKLGTVDDLATQEEEDKYKDLNIYDRADQFTYLGAKRARSGGQSASIEGEPVTATAVRSGTESLAQYQTKLDGLFANLKLDTSWEKDPAPVETSSKEIDDDGDPMIIDEAVTPTRLPTPQASPPPEEKKDRPQILTPKYADQASQFPRISPSLEADSAPIELLNPPTSEDPAHRSPKE